ncbi:unnamed protein product [Lupinus luteus]|uniref:Uncharacterized protein n=1 Tax=Lupinus luteus TaxID=3873 RepID=A0AAV1W736_LUPLU
MEAHKEMKEELEKGKETKNGSKNVAKEENNRSKLNDQVTKRVIGEFIIPSSGNNENEKAQTPNDVLAFSRSVNKVDSSLE